MTNGHSTNNARRILFWRERERERAGRPPLAQEQNFVRARGSSQESEVKKRLVFLLLLHRSLCYGSTGTHTFLDRLEEEEEATKATIPNGRTERDSLALSLSLGFCLKKLVVQASKLDAHQEIDTHFTRLSESNINSKNSRRRTQTDGLINPLGGQVAKGYVQQAQRLPPSLRTRQKL